MSVEQVVVQILLSLLAFVVGFALVIALSK